MSATVVEFKGSETDRWHRWATRRSGEDGAWLVHYLLEVKGVYRARCYGDRDATSGPLMKPSWRP